MVDAGIAASDARSEEGQAMLAQRRGFPRVGKLDDLRVAEHDGLVPPGKDGATMTAL